jgi:hypothetical protein
VIEIAALYKHWCIADSIKQFITAEIIVPEKVQLPEAFVQAAQLQSSFMRLSVWYSLLRVVVEGYQELKLSDPEVDEYLQKTEYVEALRRFRNAMFHYQVDPFSEKLMDFLDLQDATGWARGLSKALEACLEKLLPIEATIERLKQETQPGASADTLRSPPNY